MNGEPYAVATRRSTLCCLKDQQLPHEVASANSLVQQGFVEDSLRRLLREQSPVFPQPGWPSWD